MKRQKVFCENCRCYVRYRVVESPTTGTIKGITCDYVEKEAFCAECNSLIYAPEINDCNLDALHDAYRAKNGMTTQTHEK